MTALYDHIGRNYAVYRQPDPRIAAAIQTALGHGRTVINVGAGTGSYEPTDRFVVAVEPSETMVRQRLRGSQPVVYASAMNLPFADQSFDAALAILTLHHWPDYERGLAEMRRVAKTSVILTWEPAPFWLTSDYLPHFMEADRPIFPPWFRARSDCDVRVVPIPYDCKDGFLCTYWRRPEAYLDAGVREAISTFSRVGQYESGLSRLKRDLEDGIWHQRYGHLLNETELDLGYRLVTLKSAVGDPSGARSCPAS